MVYSQRIKENLSGTYTLTLNMASIVNGVYVFRIRTLGAKQQVFSRPLTLLK
jgi:hypothetical protein